VGWGDKGMKGSGAAFEQKEDAAKVGVCLVWGRGVWAGDGGCSQPRKVGGGGGEIHDCNVDRGAMEGRTGNWTLETVALYA
jgi:hypothetical protein